jgi:RNA polymerase sigma factor (sigma-70 family)
MRSGGAIKNFWIVYPFETRRVTLRVMTASGKNSAPTVLSDVDATQSTAATQRADGAHGIVNVSSPELVDIITRLYQYIRRRSNAQEASDIFQEACVEYLVAAQRGIVREPMGLAFTIARRTLGRFYYRKQRDRDVLDRLQRPDGEDAHPDGADVIDLHFLRQELNRVLSELPKTQREVLLCLSYDEKSWEETAVELRLTTNTVKKYGNEARRAARRLLNKALCPNTDPPGDDDDSRDPNRAHDGRRSGSGVD